MLPSPPRHRKPFMRHATGRNEIRGNAHERQTRSSSTCKNATGIQCAEAGKLTRRKFSEWNNLHSPMLHRRCVGRLPIACPACAVLPWCLQHHSQPRPRFISPTLSINPRTNSGNSPLSDPPHSIHRADTSISCPAIQCSTLRAHLGKIKTGCRVFNAAIMKQAVQKKGFGDEGSAASKFSGSFCPRHHPTCSATTLFCHTPWQDESSSFPGRLSLGHCHSIVSDRGRQGW